MDSYIGIEYIAANAIITLLEKKHVREISYSQLEEYGIKVFECLSSKRPKKKTFIFDKQTMERLFSDYSDYFTLSDHHGESFILLKNNVRIDELKDYFRWGISYNLYKALTSKTSLKALL